MTPILYVLVFLAAMLAAEGLYFLVQDHQRRGQASSRKRLRRMAAALRAPETAGEESILRHSGSGVSRFDRWVHSLPFAEPLGLRLYQAGLATSLSRFVALSLGLSLTSWLVASVFFADPARSLVFLGVGVVPWLQVEMRRRKRMRAFEAQFPDALDLLIRALRAGHSLSTGLQMVGKELPDPVGTELGQVADEIQLGQDARTALANLVYRVESEDLPFFVTAIAIQQETGSNLAEVLENLSHVIRERFKVYGKVRALTAMGRGTANLLAAWPLVMVGALYAVNPSYVAPLWEEPGGRVLVVVSTVMVIVGYIVCRRMATIRV